MNYKSRDCANVQSLGSNNYPISQKMNIDDNNFNYPL